MCPVRAPVDLNVSVSVLEGGGGRRERGREGERERDKGGEGGWLGMCTLFLPCNALTQYTPLLVIP